MCNSQIKNYMYAKFAIITRAVSYFSMGYLHTCDHKCYYFVHGYLMELSILQYRKYFSVETNMISSSQWSN